MIVLSSNKEAEEVGINRVMKAQNLGNRSTYFNNHEKAYTAALR